MSDLPRVLTRYRADINDELRSTFVGYPSPLYAMLRYHLGWEDEKGNPVEANNGKALRPTLCLLAAEAVGGNYHAALPAAAAVELVHNFSLIHDDIQDNDRERRHRATVWSVWGKPQAINAGTAMRILANIALTRLTSRGVPLEKAWRAQYLLDESTRRLLEGQYLDLSFENRLDVQVAEYMDMVGRKTAALISTALELGALVGTDDEKRVRALREFGWDLGIAFQIRDDFLGIWGNPEKTGKAVGADIARKKKSLPIVYALETSSDADKRALHEIYQRASVDEQGRETVLSILESAHADDKTRALADEYCERALARLGAVEMARRERQELEEIAHFLTHREM